MTPLFLSVAILDRHGIILRLDWCLYFLSLRGWMRRRGKNGYFQLLLHCSPLFSLVLDWLCFKGQISLLPALRKRVIRCQIWKIIKAVVASACPFTEIKLIDEEMKSFVKKNQSACDEFFIWLLLNEHFVMFKIFWLSRSKTNLLRNVLYRAHKIYFL